MHHPVFKVEKALVGKMDYKFSINSSTEIFAWFKILFRVPTARVFLCNGITHDNLVFASSLDLLHESEISVEKEVTKGYSPHVVRSTGKAVPCPYRSQELKTALRKYIHARGLFSCFLIFIWLPFWPRNATGHIKVAAKLRPQPLVNAGTVVLRRCNVD